MGDFSTDDKLSAEMSYITALPPACRFSPFDAMSQGGGSHRPTPFTLPQSIGRVIRICSGHSGSDCETGSGSDDSNARRRKTIEEVSKEPPRRQSNTDDKSATSVSVNRPNWTPADRKAVRDRHGRILFYYHPLVKNSGSSGTVDARNDLMVRSRSAAEFKSCIVVGEPDVLLQADRNCQRDEIRRRLAADAADNVDQQNAVRRGDTTDGSEQDERQRRVQRLSSRLEPVDTDNSNQSKVSDESTRRRFVKLNQTLQLVISTTDDDVIENNAIGETRGKSETVNTKYWNRTPLGQPRSGTAEDVNASSSASRTKMNDDVGRSSFWFSGREMKRHCSLESFRDKQYRLQQEAKLALAQAHRMARMQMEIERQPKKKSPIADMVGIPYFGDYSKCRLSRQRLKSMNVGELQLITNDLLRQIEGLNAELVQLLVERDELYMQQDSFLVDIDDLTRRI